MSWIKTIQSSGVEEGISAQMCDNASFYSALILLPLAETGHFSEKIRQSIKSGYFLARRV